MVDDYIIVHECRTFCVFFFTFCYIFSVMVLHIIMASEVVLK